MVDAALTWKLWKCAIVGSVLRIIISAPNASAAMGGEAILPLHYFEHLSAASSDVYLVCHERNRPELQTRLGSLSERVHFVEESILARRLQRWGRAMPVPVKSLTLWPAMDALTARRIRRQVIRLVKGAPGAAVVHEPAPVSPRRPSFMTGLGAPLVVGPLNGGMSYPPAFSSEVSKLERAARFALRRSAGVMNRVIRGKAEAARILVANDRTRKALPIKVPPDRLVHMHENGVDLSVFSGKAAGERSTHDFVFVGRLVDWKRVDVLLSALALLPSEYTLQIVGSGPELVPLQDRALRLGVHARVTWHGQLKQAETAQLMSGAAALLLPSIFECGGAVVLEAMASRLPVVATAWGGPLDYVLDGMTGFLVQPTGLDEMVDHFATNMRKLAQSPASARAMGEAGRARVAEEFDWNGKIEQILRVYDSACSSHSPADVGTLAREK